MVIYIKDNWVLESDTDGLNVNSDKEFVVYNPKTGKVLFESDDVKECIEYAEKL